MAESTNPTLEYKRTRIGGLPIERGRMPARTITRTTKPGVIPGMGTRPRTQVPGPRPERVESDPAAELGVTTSTGQSTWGSSIKAAVRDARHRVTGHRHGGAR